MPKSLTICVRSCHRMALLNPHPPLANRFGRFCNTFQSRMNEAPWSQLLLTVARDVWPHLPIPYIRPHVCRVALSKLSFLSTVRSCGRCHADLFKLPLPP